MPILRCGEGDLNGYGCISTQFADALHFNNPDVRMENFQWFGKIARFLYTLTLADGNKLEEADFRAAVNGGKITGCAVSGVKYTLDPQDPTIAYAEGEVTVTATADSPVPAGTYKFRHTLKQVWRLTESKFTA